MAILAFFDVRFSLAYRPAATAGKSRRFRQWPPLIQHENSNTLMITAAPPAITILNFEVDAGTQSHFSFKLELVAEFET